MNETHASSTQAVAAASTPDTPPDIRIRPRSGWQPVDWAELWRFRHLIWLFGLRDVTVRYKQTLLGGLWAIIQPLTQTLVFTLFFGKLMGMEDRVGQYNGQDVPYPVFVLCGQIFWNFFNSAATASSNSMMLNANILRKIYIPRLSIPMASTGAPVVDTLISIVLLLGVMVYFGQAFTLMALLLPVVLLLTWFVSISLGILMSALIVQYRDTRFVLPFVLQIWFFITPVIYPPSILPESYRSLMYLNPMAGLIDFSRAIMLNGPVNVTNLLISVAVTCIVFIFGVFYFARVERRFADIT